MGSRPDEWNNRKTMDIERNKSVPAVYMILEKDNKILLGRRQNTGYYDGWYGLPAGHIEVKELPMIAGVREAKEELGIDLDIKDLQFVHAEYRTAHDRTGDRAIIFSE